MTERVIDQPGVYDLGDDYYGDPCPLPSMSASDAKTLLDATPAHAAEAHPRLEVPGLPPEIAEDDDSETRKFRIGLAGHAILMGKGGDIVVVHAKSWQSNAAKADEAAALAAGKIPILAKPAERLFRTIERVKAQLLVDPEIGYDPFVKEEQNELTMIWRDGPVWCRAKPDVIDYDNRILWDPKFGEGLADPDAWVRSNIGAKSGRVDLRAAHYLHGTKQLLGPGWRYVFLLIENKRPHCISAVELPQELLDTGEDQRRKAVRTWGYCLATGDWSGWAPGIHIAEAPAYHEARWVERRDRQVTRAAIEIAREAQAPRRRGSNGGEGHGL